MRIWVTRSQPGADRTAARLRELDRLPLVAPLLETAPLELLPAEAAAFEGWVQAAGALAFTSAAGVAAFATRAGRRKGPVFTVGGATAAAAVAAGFQDVRSADGDGAALARLIAAARDGLQGEVLAPGAREPAFDLPIALAAEGVVARAVALYASRPVSRLPDAVTAALENGEVGAILLHSPAAGRALAALAPPGAPVARFLAQVLIVALSRACADALPAGFGAGRRIADAPREDRLLTLLPPFDP